MSQSPVRVPVADRQDRAVLNGEVLTALAHPCQDERHRDAGDMTGRMRQALADAQLMNRALEMECNRLRQRLRANETERYGEPLHPSREASLLHQVAELTQGIADWQAKYARKVWQLETSDAQVAAQGRRITELARTVDRLNTMISDLVGHEP